jgi:hypothetical protein
MNPDSLIPVKKKTSIAAADLFVLLERELHRRRPRECPSCSVALPFHVEVHGPEGPNWEALLIANGCRAACESVLDDIKAELQARYVLHELPH